MAEEAEWGAYLYPGTDILRNKLDLRDERLWTAERFLVRKRADDLRSGTIAIQRTRDLAHFLAIHRHLFQDVYEFAGQMRNVTIAKRTQEGETARWFIGPTQLEPWFNAIAEHVRAVDWPTLERTQLINEIADVATMVNFAHVAREGSGRTGRIFLDHIVDQTPYELNFDRLEPDVWNEASRDSIRPGRHKHPDGPLLFEPMRSVFDHIVVDRASHASSATHSAVRLAQLGQALPALDASAAVPRTTSRTPLETGTPVGLER